MDGKDQKLRGPGVEAEKTRTEPAADGEGVEVGGEVGDRLEAGEIGAGAKQRTETAKIESTAWTPRAGAPGEEHERAFKREEKGGKGIGASVEGAGGDHDGGGENDGGSFDAIKRGKLKVAGEEDAGPGVVAEEEEVDAHDGEQRSQPRLIVEPNESGNERERGEAEREAEEEVRAVKRGAVVFGESGRLDRGAAETEVAEYGEKQCQAAGHRIEAVIRGSDETGEDEDGEDLAEDADEVRKQRASLGVRGAGKDGLGRVRVGHHGSVYVRLGSEGTSAVVGARWRGR